MAHDCCDTHSHSHGHGDHPTPQRDRLLWGSGLLVAIALLWHFLNLPGPEWLHSFTHTVVEFGERMIWGVLFGAFFVGLLAHIPREVIVGYLGRSAGLRGILRATFAGVFLDLCSHGILLVGMKLYERGATLGQTMAFLIASPWNSFSLTLVLFYLIGLKWTLLFIVLSCVIAVLSGLIFEGLVRKGVLPDNPGRKDMPENIDWKAELKKTWKGHRFSLRFILGLFRDGMKESRMVLRWLLVGILLGATIRAFVSVQDFQEWFGPTPKGLLLTLLVATVTEVCSEGLAPIASDLITRAIAPGNSFAFLMAGVATDYTEILALRETTRSWKIALFLPLVTVPQVALLGWIMNTWR